MGREDPQLKLRLSEELKAKVTEAAKANGRSVNAEIVSAIESVIDAPDLNASDLRRMLDDERAMGSKTTMMLEAQFDLLADYKGVMKSANSQNLQQAGIINSLCSIITSLDPPPEVLDLVRRLSEASSQMMKVSSDKALINSAGETARDIEVAMGKAEQLLKKRQE